MSTACGKYRVHFLFQADCQVHLQPQLIPPNMEEHMSSLLTAVLPSVLNKFRVYLTLLRFLDYSISDEVTKVCGGALCTCLLSFSSWSPPLWSCSV
jgi:hypothetical protein